MFLIDWRLGLITVATLPIHALMATRVRGRTQAAGRRVQDAMGRLSAVMTELVGGARDVKAFNRQRWAGERLDNETRSLWRARLRVALLGSLSRTAHLAYWAALIAIWAFLADAVVAGTVAVGVPRGLWPVPPASRRSDSKRVERIHPDPGCARHCPPGIRLPGHTARARREDRSFVVRLAGRSTGPGCRVFLWRRKKVLNQVTFTASPGQKVALVGPKRRG